MSNNNQVEKNLEKAPSKVSLFGNMMFVLFATLVINAVAARIFVQEPYKGRFLNIMNTDKFRTALADSMVKVDQEISRSTHPITTVCEGYTKMINNSVEANYAKISQYK
jgi:hypothetical protein